MPDNYDSLMSAAEQNAAVELARHLSSIYEGAEEGGRRRPVSEYYRTVTRLMSTDIAYRQAVMRDHYAGRYATPGPSTAATVEGAEPNPARECAECHDYSRNFSGPRSRICRSCTASRRRARRRIREHGRRFGIEIEVGYSGSAYDIAQALSDAGIAVSGEPGEYGHTVTDGWRVVPDGSLSYGWEIVSPPLTWDQREQVEAVCETLSDLGCTPDRMCGVHVHHEITDFTISQIKRLVSGFRRLQPVTANLIEPSRRQSDWCSPINSDYERAVDRCRSMAEIRSLYLDRYHALNLECFSRYGTVEFRQHHASLNSDEILAWVAYGQAMVEAAHTNTLPMTADNPSRPECVGVIDTLPIKCSMSKDRLKRKIDRELVAA